MELVQELECAGNMLEGFESLGLVGTHTHTQILLRPAGLTREGNY